MCVCVRSPSHTPFASPDFNIGWCGRGHRDPPFEWTKSCTGKLSPKFDIGNIEHGGQRGFSVPRCFDETPRHPTHAINLCKILSINCWMCKDYTSLYSVRRCNGRSSANLALTLGTRLCICPKPLVQVLVLVFVLVLVQVVLVQVVVVVAAAVVVVVCG